MKMIKYCGFCGREIKVIPAKVRTVNFCSRQCSGKYRKGKPFHSTETKQKISKALMGVPCPEVSKALKGKRGADARRWQGDNITKGTGRHRAQRYFPIQPCEVCGADPKKVRIHRHHIDGITSNNDESNIKFLCTKHHFELHKLNRLQKKRSKKCLYMA